ncbi:hypothetical protein [Flavobacterium chilense]|uniref:Outer membrane protein beta-barrel domain-containing protein n=1 Tax=Flavobacterium chilense TaxID=946677 RepID=A0A1M6XEN2_9FLAO|nr:hypothetical protein [Flavobacterium chilense]SHL04363.1 hypothetical protein SAMN05444484_101108 [Flavobacterium chilense]
MKAKLLICFLFLISCQYAISQEKEVKFDFSTRDSPTLPNKIKQGDFYRIHITSINPNLYSIIVNSKDTLISSALKMPTFADIDLSGFNSLGGAAAPIDTEAKVAVEKTVNGKRITDIVSAKNNTTAKELNIHLNTAEELKKELQSLAAKYEDLRLEIYKQRIDQLSTAPKTAQYDGVAALVRFTALRKDITTQQTKIANLNSDYKRFIEDPVTKKFLEKNPEYKIKTEVLGESAKLLTTKSQELLDSISADNVTKLITSVLYLNGKDQKFISLPIQFSKERATVNIAFTPRDSTIGVQSENMSFTFPLFSKDYWSIGTSFYYSNMTQSRYNVQTTTIDSVANYQVIKQDDLDRELGIAVFLRGGLKVHQDWIGVHFNIGPGLSINENPQPRLLGGFGLSIGRKHSLTLDYGGIVGYVDRLAAGIDFQPGHKDKIENLTVKKLQVANFFAIGYTFRL